MLEPDNLQGVRRAVCIVLAMFCAGLPLSSVADPVPEATPLSAQAEYVQVERVHMQFNRLKRISDARLWGRDDYWATPSELLRAGGGDCEDFATAKYFALRQLGVPAERLRLAYTRAFDAARGRIEPHVVLWYRSTQDTEWRVLDSLTSRIQYQSQRGDLLPRLTFNERHVAYWHAADGEIRFGGPELIGRWQVLLQRQQALQALASREPGQSS